MVTVECVEKSKLNFLCSKKKKIVNSVIQRAFDEAKMWREVNLNNEKMLSNMVRFQNRESRWLPPLQGTIKCNVNSTWRNASLYNGGAWIARDYTYSLNQILHAGAWIALKFFMLEKLSHILRIELLRNLGVSFGPYINKNST